MALGLMRPWSLRPCGLAGRCLLAALIVLGAAACRDEAGEGGDLAVLAQADEAYAQARPGVTLDFPRDHGAHPAFRIEWWYVTANLEDETGRPWGMQWTLFRTAVRPPGNDRDRNPGPWQDGQVYMAHFAVTAPDAHRGFQRYARGGRHDGLRQAGVTAEPFAAWLDDWRLESSGPEWLPLKLTAAQDGVEVALELSSDQPLVLQGREGFSQKHPGGGGSHYYSQPWLEARGHIRFGGVAAPVRGEAWLDREWSSQFLQADQVGWDWFALHLADGRKLMAFQLRSREGRNFTHAALFTRDGSRLAAAPGDLELVPLARYRTEGRELPLTWRLSWPAAQLELVVDAPLRDQWMGVDFPYWEGRVTVRDPDGGAAGRGYMELTGYAPASRR